MTDAQIKVLEELGFKLIQAGLKKIYRKIYSRGITFLICNISLDGFINAVGCVYNQIYERDLAILREEGIV